MNFQELLTKMKQIDENTLPVAPVHTDGPSTEECGGMPMPISIGHSEAPKQSDSVTMNVSMNGSGAGGIRDLMRVLKDIENGPDDGDHTDQLFGEPAHDHDAQEPLIGDMVNAMAHEEDIGEEVDETWGNSAHGSSGPHTQGIGAVTRTGDDFASKGHEVRKVNGGGNPLHESLVEKLSAMYNTIKES